MTALLLGVMVLLFAGNIVYQIIKYYPLLKDGQDLTKIVKEENFRAALSKLFASAIVTEEDLQRLEEGSNPTLGNPEAKVKVVEYIDLDCTYCKNSEPAARLLAENHPDDVYLIFKDFPVTELHPRAERAAVAARCVFMQNDTARYWRFHDLLFQTQGNRTDEDLSRFAQQTGADMQKYERCYSSDQELEAVRKSVQDGMALGVRGTPTLFFNGVKIQGDMDLKSLETVVEEAMKVINR
ncbi:MAG: DsbA family protein [Patescibacteria group bacterium]